MNVEIYDNSCEKALPPITEESIALAKQAMSEMAQTGTVKTTCPRCKKIVEVWTTSKGERTIAACECEYVRYSEINL